MMTPSHELAARLVDARYHGLFLRGPADGALAPIRADDLAALVIDPSADGEARFLAAELWLAGHRELPPPADAAEVAALYARALAEGWVADAGPWGLPGEVGPIGLHVLRLGDAAVTALRPLLDDARGVVYGGSVEATAGNRYGYRVKDLAAFYLARLVPLPYELHVTPAERDREIDALRALLA